LLPEMPTFAYYGTPRGAVPNYINGFAVQSWAYTSTFDAIGAAKLITVPTPVDYKVRSSAAPPAGTAKVIGYDAA
jgi:hypothetical protein